MLLGRWKKLATLSIAGGSLTGIPIGLSLTDNDSPSSWGIVRLGRASKCTLDIMQHYKTKLYGSKLDPSSDEYAELRSKVHREAAEKLLKLCCANKGVYIKVGQHIGALDYLLPPEYVEVMRVLHSKAPVTSMDDIRKVIREELKQEIEELFCCFDEVPLGTASLAQVHKATLKNGCVVAVKVQHPEVFENSRADMKTMEILVGAASMLFKELDMTWLVRTTKKNLPKELDFTQEANNIEIIRQKLANFQWLKIPNVHQEYVTSRIIIMDFMDGAEINNLPYIRKQHIDRYDVAQKLGEMYAHMIFKHGFIHSDPHPGNILIRQDEDEPFSMILLDHGLYAELSDEFRWNYSKFWMAILSRDEKAMETYSMKLGIGPLYPLLVCMVTGRTWEAVKEGVGTKQTAEERKMFRDGLPIFLTKVGEVLRHVDQELLLILKTNDLLRGIESALNIERSQTSFMAMTRCCVQAIYEEKILKSKSQFDRFSAFAWKSWVLFKINMYQVYLSLSSVLWVW